MQANVEEPTLEPPAHYVAARHRLSVIEEISPDSKSVSSLTVERVDATLLCGKDYSISIKYTIAGETPGSVNVMYLVSIDCNLVNKLFILFRFVSRNDDILVCYTV